MVDIFLLTLLLNRKNIIHTGYKSNQLRLLFFVIFFLFIIAAWFWFRCFCVLSLKVSTRVFILIQIEHMQSNCVSWNIEQILTIKKKLGGIRVCFYYSTPFYFCNQVYMNAFICLKLLQKTTSQKVNLISLWNRTKT